MDSDYYFRKLNELIKKQTQFITHCGPILANLFLKPDIIPAIVQNQTLFNQINQQQQQMQKTQSQEIKSIHRVCQIKEVSSKSNEVKIVTTIAQYQDGEQKQIQIQEVKKEILTNKEKNLLKKKKKYSGYHIYMLEKTQELQNLDFVTKYKKIGQNWKEMSNEQKQVYKLKAQQMNLQVKQENQQSIITVKKSERNRIKLEQTRSSQQK
ncbi:hypothetical protein pb186bvf_007437 [Paramecium bursaria]